MMGSQRECALNSMLNEKIDPSVYIRNEAKTLMREGNNIYNL